MRTLSLLIVGIVVGWAIVANALGPYVPPGMSDPTELGMQGSPALAPADDATPLIGRFQVSAYGSPSSNGCYIIDTATGRLWRATNRQPPQLVGELPQQQPSSSTATPQLQPTFTESTLMNAEPETTVVEPSPSITPSAEMPDGEVSPLPSPASEPGSPR